MTRRGAAKKCAGKESSKPSTSNPRSTGINNNNSNEEDEKAVVVTPAKPIIKRIPNSEICTTTAMAATVTKSKSIAKTPSFNSIKSNYTIADSEVNVNPTEISSDVSDYYSEDFNDSENYDSDEDFGPYGRHSQREGYEYLKEIFYGSRSDTSDSDDIDVDGLFDNGFGRSGMEEILEDFIQSQPLSSVAIYVIKVATFLENFQNNNATPIVRARIQDFIRSIALMPFSSLLDFINYFKLELVQLADNPLIDFPVYDPQASTSFESNSRSSLSNNNISRLPRHSYRGQTQREKRLKESPHKCCICMAELEIDEELILLEKCSHRFHSGCLESWLRRSDHCPICRTKVKPPPALIN